MNGNVMLDFRLRHSSPICLIAPTLLRSGRHELIRPLHSCELIQHACSSVLLKVSRTAAYIVDNGIGHKYTGLRKGEQHMEQISSARRYKGNFQGLVQVPGMCSDCGYCFHVKLIYIQRNKKEQLNTVIALTSLPW